MATEADTHVGRFGWDRDWNTGAIRYPDPAVEILDPRFASYRLGNAAVERLCTGMRWAEGPVWFGDSRCLIWSDIPNNRMMRWDEQTSRVTVFRQPSHNTNGNTRDQQGRLISCEHLTRRVTRTEYNGELTVLADTYQGKRLNAPNDVVVANDGAVWFTDPGYGALMDYEGEVQDLELPPYVFRWDSRDGELTVVADDFVKPNGLCFSPGGDKLYIADTGRSQETGGPPHVRVFDVVDGTRLAGGRVFVDMKPSSADGIRTDIDGNLWASAGWGDPTDDGVHCYGPDGDLLGKIHLPEPCSNLCFGGRKRKRLFMTCGQSVFALYVEAQGAQRP